MNLVLNRSIRIWFLTLLMALTNSPGIFAEKGTDLPLTLVLAEFSPAEGKRADVLKWLAGVLPETRAYDGCKSLSVYQEMDSNKIILVEHWETKEKFIAYRDWRVETGSLAALAEMLDSDPVFRFSLDTKIQDDKDYLAVISVFKNTKIQSYKKIFLDKRANDRTGRAFLVANSCKAKEQENLK